MMKNGNTSSSNVMEMRPRISESRRIIRVFSRRGVVVFGMVVILVAIIVAIFAPLLAPYDPNEFDLSNKLLSPSKTHLLGTDSIGRDVFSRVIYGSRISFVIGVVVVTIAAAVGMGLGLIAGYTGGWLSTIIMRLMDALMSFPMILLAMVIAALLGGGMKNIIIALTIGLIPVYARLMCGQVLSTKEGDFILAQSSMGAGSLRIMIRHLLPNCFPPMIVLMTMMLGSVILAEAGLSFLGIGIEPPTASWGGMVSDGRSYLVKNPMLSVAPGIAIMLVVFGFNMVGDGLRDALDPRLRGAL